MAANWATFQTKVVLFLKGKQSGGFEQTANFFANEYDIVVKTSALLFGNQVTSTTKPPLFVSFLKAFNTMYQMKTETSPQPYIQLASEIILNYWKNIQFSPVPPHPPAIVPAPGVLTNYHGDPNTLGNELYTAFNSKEEILVASNLMLAFSNHMKTINGVYLGLISTPTGLVLSPPIPWVGVF